MCVPFPDKSEWSCKLAAFNTYPNNNNIDLFNSRQVDGISVPLRTPKEGVVVLGSLIPGDGSSDSDVDYRSKQAWKGFQTRRKLFCYRHIPAALRPRTFNKSFPASLLWGSSAWVVKASICNSLRKVHQKMLSCMWSMKKQPQRTWKRFFFKRARYHFPRTNAAGIAMMHQVLLLRSHLWHGHVATTHRPFIGLLVIGVDSSLGYDIEHD